MLLLLLLAAVSRYLCPTKPKRSKSENNIFLQEKQKRFMRSNSDVAYTEKSKFPCGVTKHCSGCPYCFPCFEVLSILIKHGPFACFVFSAQNMIKLIGFVSFLFRKNNHRSITPENIRPQYRPKYAVLIVLKRSQQAKPKRS